MVDCSTYISLVSLVFLSRLSIAAFSGISNDIHDRIDNSVVTSLVARLDSLEETTASLTQRCKELEHRNLELELLLTQEAEVLSEFSRKSERHEERLAQIEKALMVVIPEQLQHATADIIHQPVRDSQSSFRQETLEEFLGNRAAELVALLPNEVSRNDADTTFDSDTIGKAVTYLTDTNQKLVKKVEHLERKVLEGVRQTEDEPDDIQIQMLEELLERVSEVEDAVTSDDVGIRGKSNAESRKSAFSAAAIKPQFGRDGAITPLQLGHVFLNKGEDFNTTNSTFICEVPGYYYFTFTMRTYVGQTLAVSLVKNHDYVVALFSDEADRNVMDSQSVMLELVPGDLIYLALGPSQKYAYYSDNNKLSTFSGFLLYKKS